MNWESLIEVLMDRVPSVDIRTAIYKDLLDQCDYSEVDVVEEAMHVDTAFDDVAEKFLENVEDDDDLDDDDDDDYDDDSEDWESDWEK